MSNKNNNTIKTDAMADVRRAKMIKIVDDADFIVCPDCGNGIFIQALYAKKLSGLVTGAGVDMIHPVAIYMCATCGRVETGEGELSTIAVVDFNDKYGRAKTDDEKTINVPQHNEPTTTNEQTSNIIIP